MNYICNDKITFMLAHTYKRIGIWFFVAILIAAIVAAFFPFNETPDPRSLFARIMESLALLALGLIAFSKEKIDDEYLRYVRGRCIMITAVLSFIYALIDSFFFQVHHLMILEILQIQVLFYLLIFHLLKRAK